MGIASYVLGPLAGVVLAVGAAPFLVEPPAIEVHSLTFGGEMVTQDRTVASESETFFARWRAEVVDVATGAAVPGCKGQGEWDYPAGRKAATMTLPRWVGSEACTAERLPDQFYLRATWIWGDDQTGAKSRIYQRN
ncbi:MAG: hypothetical protein QNJ44_22555 [Rhodobacter sp.]|nr:hypothetical protein [Rhodobacter sp.]